MNNKPQDCSACDSIHIKNTDINVVNGHSCQIVQPEYQSLYDVLMLALNQAQNGKGKERHGQKGKNFEDQPIMTIQDMVGPGFALGQAIKKCREAYNSEWTNDRKIKELLGAINYIAAAVIYLQEGGQRNERKKET